MSSGGTFIDRLKGLWRTTHVHHWKIRCSIVKYGHCGCGAKKTVDEIYKSYEKNGEEVTYYGNCNTCGCKGGM